MKKHKIHFLAVLALCMGLSAQLLGQSQPVNLMGNTLLEIANGMAILPSGASVFGGRSSIPNQGNKIAYMVWESATTFGTVDFAKSYSLGTGDLEIKAVDAAQPAGSIAVVANRFGAGINPDGLFMHISATGTVLAARAFNSSNNEFLHNVKCLSDGSFVVVGSITSAFTQMRSAFVTRIGTPAQGYAVQWSRALGSISGPTVTFDYAAAADQYTDGSILVAGFTDQGSSSAEGSVLLWKLSAAGTDLSLVKYTMASTVRRPFPSDMRITSSNSVEIVGNALDDIGNFKGFHMRVTPSLGSAIYTQLSFADDASRSIELRGLDFRGANKPTWASGVMSMPTSTGGTDFEGLLVEFSGLTGLMRSHLLGFTGDDALNDLRLDASSNVRSAGLSNKPQSLSVILQSTNVLNARTNALGLNCLTTDVSLIATEHSNVAQGFGLGTANPVTIVVSPITVVVANIGAAGQNSCVDARMGIVDAVEVPEEAVPITAREAQPQVYPNPASGTATLRLPAYNAPTPVYIYDLAGKRVRTAQATGTETQLDLGGLTPGLYIVAAQTTSGNHRLKLMVE